MERAIGSATADGAMQTHAQGRIDASTGVRRLRALARAGAVAALVLLVAACSSLRLGYNNADTLLLYSLDRYFDLDDAQEELARERVRALLAWHRSTQLPDYAALLAGAQQRLDATPAAPLTADEVLALQGEINARVITLARQAAPDLAQLAASLSDAQMARFRARLADENAKLRRERAGPRNQDPAAAATARAERGIERARDWLGPLTPAQQALVRAAVQRSPDGERRWLDERERRQQALLALLERMRSEKAAPPAGGALLADYFVQLVEPGDPQRRAEVRSMRETNARLIADLLNSASSAQKAALIQRLRGYAEDFTVLASQGARS